MVCTFFLGDIGDVISIFLLPEVLLLLLELCVIVENGQDFECFICDDDDDGNDDGCFIEFFTNDKLSDSNDVGGVAVARTLSSSTTSIFFVQISQFIGALVLFVVLRKRKENDRRIKWGDGFGIRVGRCISVIDGLLMCLWGLVGFDTDIVALDVFFYRLFLQSSRNKVSMKEGKNVIVIQMFRIYNSIFILYSLKNKSTAYIIFITRKLPINLDFKRNNNQYSTVIFNK